MSCAHDGNCEFKPKIDSRFVARTADEVRYGRLWAEIEMEKQLREKK
jgi:hypothetical protein